MRKSNPVFISIGLSAALLGWFFVESTLFIFDLIDNTLLSSQKPLFSGLFLGLSFGGLIVAAPGYLNSNLDKFLRGLWLGALFGSLGGIVAFSLIDALVLALKSENLFLQNFLQIQRWVVISIAVGCAFGIRDNKTNELTRSAIVSAVVGLAAGIFIQLVLFISPGFFTRGIGLLAFGSLLSFSLYMSPYYGRTNWLKSLNGKLKGYEFELTEPSHNIGGQTSDYINLSHYSDINQSHVRIYRCDEGYAVSDNDPDGNTFVNFRPANETTMKHGDILKLGTALFQFCSKE